MIGDNAGEPFGELSATVDGVLDREGGTSFARLKRLVFSLTHEFIVLTV